MFNSKQPFHFWQATNQNQQRKPDQSAALDSVQRIAYNTFWIATLIVGLSLVLCKICIMLLG